MKLWFLGALQAAFWPHPEQFLLPPAQFCLAPPSQAIPQNLPKTVLPVTLRFEFE